MLNTYFNLLGALLSLSHPISPLYPFPQCRVANRTCVWLTSLPFLTSISLLTHFQRMPKCSLSWSRNIASTNDTDVTLWYDVPYYCYVIMRGGPQHRPSLDVVLYSPLAGVWPDRIKEGACRIKGGSSCRMCFGTHAARVHESRRHSLVAKLHRQWRPCLT